MIKKLLFLLLIFLNFSSNAASAPKKDDIALKITVSDEFVCKVYCLYPAASKITQMPISQLARCLQAGEKAQEVLNKGMFKGKFVFWMEEDDEFEYREHYSAQSKEIFALQTVLSIPPKTQEKVEKENKKIAQEDRLRLQGKS